MNDVQTMYAYHKQGHTLQETGDYFNLSKQAISQAFKRNGYEVQPARKRFPKDGAAILAYIRDYKAQYQDTPTYKAIALHVTGDARNNGNMYRMVETLVELGYLYRAGANDEVLMLTQPQPPIPERVK